MTTLLCILDGFGINKEREHNAIALANTPNIDKLLSTYPNATLQASGLFVGLPDGQMGNSEVGHLNIGAGRVVEQWLVRISRELREGALTKFPGYSNFISNLKDDGKIHIFGLFSDGGIHSHIEHLKLLIENLTRDTNKTICIHLITDGRDTEPMDAKNQYEKFLEFLAPYKNVKVADITGRFYAMDRDKRWDRVKRAYDMYTKLDAPRISSIEEYLSKSYSENIGDEFIEPAILNASKVSENDSLIFFNFRADRMREIVRTFGIEDFDGFERNIPVLNKNQILCFTEYDETYNLPVLFEKIDIKNFLSEVVSKKGLKQFKTAETEKYAHVTFFLNGGIEAPVDGEDREVIPSPREVKTYDEKPEMSAYQVCDKVVEVINSKKYDLVVVNFANPDMVGHTGIESAAIKAIEAVDTCVGKVFDALLAQGGQGLIIADHGNAESMLNENGTPNTAHTTNLVPVILVGYKEKVTLKDGALCDVAPTILKMMEIEKPSEMTGNALF